MELELMKIQFDYTIKEQKEFIDRIEAEAKKLNMQVEITEEDIIDE